MSENRKEELIKAVQRQVAMRGELLQLQRRMVREVSLTDVRRPRRAETGASFVLMLLLLAATTCTVAACTTVPDGRDMSAGADRSVVLAETNQIIAAL